ncbi:hypothetical protein A2115_02105 [Candidatus Woesebacteria bacterium GWA1_41_8]|uniref:Uncharacterized protein n=1 Tax=Candidatus Woesebacteria bacterium GWA1_41_8 TaxID=1802471 RepID=A0A1F7WH26_9BACT|nr:MAG: hypothetical protein A2115_02105 [Candidatus Woesebacteria bacterium GWA1_41_8]
MSGCADEGLGKSKEGRPSHAEDQGPPVPQAETDLSDEHRRHGSRDGSEGQHQTGVRGDMGGCGREALDEQGQERREDASGDLVRRDDGQERPEGQRPAARKGAEIGNEAAKNRFPVHRRHEVVNGKQGDDHPRQEKEPGGGEEIHAVPEGVRQVAAEQRSQGTSQKNGHLQQAHGIAPLLLGGGGSDEHHGGGDGSGYRTLEGPERQQLPGRNGQALEHHDDGAAEHGAQEHGLPAVVVRQAAPDGSHDGKADRGNRLDKSDE